MKMRLNTTKEEYRRPRKQELRHKQTAKGIPRVVVTGDPERKVVKWSKRTDTLGGTSRGKMRLGSLHLFIVVLLLFYIKRNFLILLENLERMSDGYMKNYI